MTHLIVVIIFIILIFCIIKLSKENGRANARNESNKKDREIINTNNNLNRNDLIDKLHDIQKKL